MLFPDSEEWSMVIRETLSGKIDDTTEAKVIWDLIHSHTTQPEMPEEGEFARIMSLHKSKGLTSKVVIVAGCIEGLLPNGNNKDAGITAQDEALKEQRRLFYVAITRCTELMVLSSVTQLERNLAFKMGAKVSGKGLMVRTIASRFIQELRPDAPDSQSGIEWQRRGYQN